MIPIVTAPFHAFAVSFWLVVDGTLESPRVTF